MKRLGVDYMDLYIMRSWDQKTPIEESVKAMGVSTFISLCMCTLLMQTSLLSSAHALGMHLSQHHHGIALSLQSMHMPVMHVHRADKVCRVCSVTH